ncbi:TonB-dependent receptor [Pseudomonas sp.]|uniref:TonB-dependent receptor n=1 Tax=Pseudomonas sp. TaxID=306 RepID=UPI0026196432|nr:TonB-dependent receptor [Pseudomonas sp.]
MPTCFNSRSSSNARTGGLQQCTLSLLTVAMLLAGVQAAPAIAATEDQPATRSVGNYKFAISQQPLASALNDFTAVTGWQVGLPAELAQDVSSPGARGSLSPEKALERLLTGTNLTYRKLSANNIVLEKRSATSGTLALQQVTISATRNEQDVSAVPSTVTVHDRQALDRQNVNTIKDLVRYEPGVSVGGAGQRGGISGYNIRGIDGDRILTQIDGVEIPNSFFNGPYAKTQRNYVDPEIVRSVEVLRGPASVLYGSNAIGGAVSYYTLNPDDIIKPGQDVGARFKTGYSSADRSWLKSGTVAGRSGEFDGLLHVSRRDGHETESYGDHGGTGLSRTAANPEVIRTTNVLAKAGWNYNDNDRLAFTYENYNDKRDINQKSVIGGIFMNGRPFNMYRSRNGTDNVKRERFGLENTFAFDSALADHGKLSLNYQVAKTHQSSEEHYKASRDVYRTRDTLYKEQQWVFDAQFDKAFAIASTDHLLTYGATIKHEKVTGSRVGQGTCLAASPKKEDGCPAAGAPADNLTDTFSKLSDFPDPTINTYSLFAQDEISWNQWTFMPGVRYDYTKMKPKMTEAFLATVNPDPDPAKQDPVNSATKTWHRLSPKLGVTYSFNDNYTWFGQYSEGFRTPTAKALFGRFENLQQGYVVEPNPNLEPEKSKSYETGLRGNFDEGSFDVAVFYNKYRDFIDEDNLSPGYGIEAFKSRNIKHATIKGIEAKGKLQLDAIGAPQGLYTKGSIAYAHGQNNDSGEPLNSVNPLTGVFGLGYEQDTYGALLSWTLVKSKNRVDETSFKSPDIAGKQFKTPGFGTLDLSGFYKVTKDVTVSAGIYNLTDKEYWLWDDVRSYDAVGEAAVVNPANLERLTQPGRNFAINLIWEI